MHPFVPTTPSHRRCPQPLLPDGIFQGTSPPYPPFMCPCGHRIYRVPLPPTPPKCVPVGPPHLHVRHTELAALSHQLAIDRHTGTAIKVEPPTITALLVGVQVDAARLVGPAHTQQQQVTHAVPGF